VSIIGKDTHNVPDSEKCPLRLGCKEFDQFGRIVSFSHW